MALASVALAQARTLLNDDLASIWSDAALIPKLQIAHQELQGALWDVGSPVVREESTVITVAIGAVTLGVSQPADLLAPMKLYEYDSPSNLNPVEMTEVFYIPKNIAQTTKLVYWCWRKETIMFLGSSMARGVLVQYRKLLTIPTVVGSDLGITFAEMYLGPRAAALAAGSVGNEAVLKIATDMASSAFAKVLSANRGQQTPPTKP
jgi:hypothetical protein